jgi:hypothetical protein
VTRGRLSDRFLERDVVGSGVGVAKRRLEPRTDVLAQPRAQRVVEADEDRDLRHQGEKRGERVDGVLHVELDDLLVLALFVVLVLGLDRLHLRRDLLELVHRVHLLEGERQEESADHDRQRDDRQSHEPPMMLWKRTRTGPKMSISG